MATASGDGDRLQRQHKWQTKKNVVVALHQAPIFGRWLRNSRRLFRMKLSIIYSRTRMNTPLTEYDCLWKYDQYYAHLSKIRAILGKLTLYCFLRLIIPQGLFDFYRRVDIFMNRIRKPSGRVAIHQDLGQPSSSIRIDVRVALGEVKLSLFFLISDLINMITVDADAT